MQLIISCIDSGNQFFHFYYLLNDSYAHKYHAIQNNPCSGALGA